MKHLHHLALVLVFCLVARPSSACNPCTWWGTWGERVDVCADPSEAELSDMLSCWSQPTPTGCASECATWLDSYNACEASGDPACTFATASLECDYCIYGRCWPSTWTCSIDLTGSGCAYCVEVASGAPAGLLCDKTTSFDSWTDLEACACSGVCAADCAVECADGGFDVSNPSAPCVMCVQDTGAGCGKALEVCSAT